MVVYVYKTLILLMFGFVLVFISSNAVEKKVRIKEPSKIEVKSSKNLLTLYYDENQKRKKYIGEESNGIPNGNGTLYSINGIKIYEGEFLDGRPHGNGKMYDDEGKLQFSGVIIKGTPTEKGKWYIR